MRILAIALAVAAMPGAASADPISALTASEADGGRIIPSWANRVHAIAARSIAAVARRTPHAVYLVRFHIAADGSSSGYSIIGSGGGPEQYARITGALALSRFPPPPDGLGHAVQVRVRL